MSPPRVTRPLLTREQVRSHYDGPGSSEDGQWAHGKRAVKRLIELGEFSTASQVVEFGCGNGALAQRLMEDHLPIYAKYSGFDLSETMVQNARSRLIPFGSRVTVTKTDGRPRVPLPQASCDRFVSTYVLELLTSQDIAKLLGQAWVLLRPGGLLCLASLTHGTTFLSRTVIKIWKRRHDKNPTKVGGCRPISLTPFLGPASWKVLYSDTVISRGVPSEVLVARPRAHARNHGDPK